MSSVIIPILIYIIIILLLFIIKPSIFFDNYGNLRTYNHKSMITLDIIYPIIALMSYYLSLIFKILLFN